MLGAIFCIRERTNQIKYEHIQIMVTDDYSRLSRNHRWGGRGLFWVSSSLLIIFYKDEQECWSNWGGFSAQANRCYRADCSSPKKGHLVLLQTQGKAQIREFVVLTSECKVIKELKSLFLEILVYEFNRQQTTNRVSSQRILETFLESPMDITPPAGNRVPIVLNVPLKWNMVK